jgi:hypothetical protein
VYSVTGKAAIGGSLCDPFRRGPFQFPQRVKAFEFQAAVVAQQFVQAGHLKYHRGIVISALKTRALASGTPHISL